jgi:hypothetical protein
MILLVALMAGCHSYGHGLAVVRPEFLTYDRVALWSSLSRETEDFFIPTYMQSFPNQLMVERRDVSAIIGEQDMLPERLNEETRAKLRRILGVKAILFPSVTKDGFAMKAIETETGAITASVFVDANDKVIGAVPMQELVRRAVSSLRSRADAIQHGQHGFDTKPTESAAVPPPEQAGEPSLFRPPVHD